MTTNLEQGTSGAARQPSHAETGRDTSASQWNKNRKTARAYGADDETDFDWSKVGFFLSLLNSYRLLLGTILALAMLVTVVNYIRSPKEYTAIAVLAPPGPSPTGSLLSGVGGGASASLASRVLGAGGGAAKSDNYQDFQQLLPSTRLSQSLLGRAEFVHTAFASRWDASAKQWKQPGMIGTWKKAIKRSLGMPVADQPIVDDVVSFLDAHLKVAKTSQSQGSLLGGLSPYVQVSFTFNDPGEAERLLDQILSETDQTIREDQRRNVIARIGFLRQELAREAMPVDERAALISILSDQEHVLAMIEADQHFATTWIIPPYASPAPTSPSALGRSLAVAVFVSMLLFLGLVYSSLRAERINRLIRRFKRKDRG